MFRKNLEQWMGNLKMGEIFFPINFFFGNLNYCAKCLTYKKFF